MERHFTNSVYVFREDTKQFLYIKHKKLKKWLQPGGHIEDNELPDEAALREVMEEMGLDVRLVGERRPRLTDQIRPFALQLNVIQPDEHEHIDFIYLAIADDVTSLKLNPSETEGLSWFSMNEIEADSFDTFEAQKYWSRYFYNYMTNGDACKHE